MDVPPGLIAGSGLKLDLASDDYLTTMFLPA